MLIRRMWHRLLRAWWSLTVPPRVLAAGVELGEGVTFYGMPLIHKAANSRIVLGDKMVVCSDGRFTALGLSHPVVLRTEREGAEIIIGANTGLSGSTICAAISIRIGKECLFGANSTVVDTDFHAVKAERRRFISDPGLIVARPVRIADNVFIGAGSIILKGVEIGLNSVIGAGSVLTSDVPAGAVFAGNPAKHIGRVS